MRERERERERDVFSIPYEFVQYFSILYIILYNNVLLWVWCQTILLVLHLNNWYIKFVFNFESFTVAIMTLFTVREYKCHKWPRICSTCRKHFSYAWLISGFITRVIRRVSPVEQELLTLLVHLKSPPALVRFLILDLWFSV